MRIAVDGMGGDNAPFEIVKGCAQASNLVSDEIWIVGDEEQIHNALSRLKYNKDTVKVVHASDVITNDDSPVKAVRSKTGSSLVVGINLVKNKEADLFISAGNTGAIMAGSLFILGRIRGIDRPALAMTYPILGDQPCLLVDAGANAECKPGNLLEFATMGSIYMEKVFGIKQPEIGLVNIGTEEKKGTTVLKAAYKMLQESDLNFVGNVESRDIPRRVCDVIVCDGFTGNVILKLTEGLAWNILKLIKAKFTSGILPKVGSALLLGKFKELRSEFDYSEYGGAPILGVKGAMLKIHGSSNANAVKNAILKGIPFVNNNVVQMIENSVVELEEIIGSE